MRRRPLIFFSISIFLLLVFFFFSRAVRSGFMKQVDFNTTVKIQGRFVHEGRIDTDTVMEGSTFFVSPEASLLWLGIVTLVIIIRSKKRRIWLSGLIIPITFGLMIAAELYGKTVVHHPSPPFFMIRNPITIFPRYYVNEAFSYPSGHVARAVFLAVLTIWMILPIIKRKFWKVCMIVLGLGFVFLVSVSRIYLGHHWLTDVIGGGLLGMGFVLLNMCCIRHTL